MVFLPDLWFVRTKILSAQALSNESFGHLPAFSTTHYLPPFHFFHHLQHHGITFEYLVDIAYWFIFLARKLIPDNPLPWQKKQTILTPGRVKQGLPWLFSVFTPPTRLVQTRGKSPGWPKGRPRPPLPRYQVTRKGSKQAKSG